MTTTYSKGTAQKLDTLQTDRLLEKFADEYAKSRRPLTVNFRKLTPTLTSSDRLTHLIHWYPAKLLGNIPYFFLSSETLSKVGDVVLDPFCGSGTVLLEAAVAGRIGLGAESNPLARLIAEAKVTPIDPTHLRLVSDSLLARIPTLKERLSTPDVINIDYWFYPHVARQLTAIRSAIDKIDQKEIRSFFLLALSQCVRRVSLADPRLSVPVRLEEDQYPRRHWLYEKTVSRLKRLKRINVVEEFRNAAEQNITRMGALWAAAPIGCGEVFSFDARHLTNDISSSLVPKDRLGDGTVQLVITSPPYAGAQKYVRASSLSLGWLGLCDAAELASLERLTIGREHYRLAEYEKAMTTGLVDADSRLAKIRRMSPIRAHIVAQYLIDMRTALVECARVVKRGGYLVLVAAPNTVCGSVFPTDICLHAIAEECGFRRVFSVIDRIRSRLLMTRRNGTAGMIHSETVTLFQRGA